MDEITPYFEVLSKLNKLIRTTKSHWDLITLVKHPIIRGKESLVRGCLQSPEEVRLSQDDKTVYLYYKQWEKQGQRPFLCNSLLICDLKIKHVHFVAIDSQGLR